MERTIELYLDMERIKEDGPTLNDIQKAVGRMALWGRDSYPQVRIESDGCNDLLAYYSNKDSSRSFVIGAVWRAGSSEYTFHS